MEKVDVRVVGRPILKTQPGDIVRVSRRDAQILTRLGRVEPVDSEPPVDYESMTKDELAAEAERRGLVVDRADGAEGTPLKADYVSALSQQGGRYQRRDMRARD